MERIIGIEPTSSPWQGDIIAIIRYPRFIATFILHNYYIKIENNKTIVCGESYIIKDNEIKQICKDDEYIEISNI